MTGYVFGLVLLFVVLAFISAIAENDADRQEEIRRSPELWRKNILAMRPEKRAQLLQEERERLRRGGPHDGKEREIRDRLLESDYRLLDYLTGAADLDEATKVELQKIQRTDADERYREWRENIRAQEEARVEAETRRREAVTEASRQAGAVAAALADAARRRAAAEVEAAADAAKRRADDEARRAAQRAARRNAILSEVEIDIREDAELYFTLEEIVRHKASGLLRDLVFLKRKEIEASRHRDAS